MAEQGAAPVIIVSRTPSKKRDLFRKYRVELDGDHVGSLGRGDSLRLAVEPGVHHLRAVIDWTGSATESVTLGEGEVVYFDVGPAGSALKLWQLAGSKQYLELNRR